MNQLYIPKGARDKTYFFEGFGMDELREVLIPLILGLGFGLLLLIFSNVFSAAIFVISYVFALILFVSKTQDGLSMIDFLSYAFMFRSSKKNFDYVYLQEDFNVKKNHK